MSQASTPFAADQYYFMGNPSVVKLSAGQWISINAERIVNFKDLLEFKDDDIDNVITNLRQPQSIWHPAEEIVVGSAEIIEDLTTVPPVQFQPAVL